MASFKDENLWVTSQPLLPNSHANRTAASTSRNNLLHASACGRRRRCLSSRWRQKSHLCHTSRPTAHFLPPYSLPPWLLESISHAAGSVFVSFFSKTLPQLEFTLVVVLLCSEVAELATGVGTVDFCGFSPHCGSACNSNSRKQELLKLLTMKVFMSFFQVYLQSRSRY